LPVRTEGRSENSAQIITEPLSTQSVIQRQRHVIGGNTLKKLAGAAFLRFVFWHIIRSIEKAGLGEAIAGPNNFWFLHQ